MKQEIIYANLNISTLITVIIRLFLATLLGGIIGYEREHYNRPAGIRTHTLVCLGSALIMLVSEYIYSFYGENVDPTRLGAQVISGIGFLGAGTIIKEGLSVKGLTTAASLWAISCIGLAIGMGFYSGAIIATVIIYFTLQFLKKIIQRHAKIRTISLVVTSLDNVVYKSICELEKLKINVLSNQVEINESGKTIVLHLTVMTNNDQEIFEYALSKLRMMDEVISQYEE